MNTIIGKRHGLVPVSAVLDTWTSQRWDKGIQLERLSALDRVTVTTVHSTYELIVLTPQRAEVMVRGGEFFREFTRARLAGSSLGGSFLKLHAIHVGFRMEIVDEARSVVTSPVYDIVVATARGRIM